MRRSFYRQPLYDRIWTETATRVAADLGMGSAVLKQACLEAGVPWPTTRYWAQLQAGKHPVRPPLPPRPPGARPIVITVGHAWTDGPVEEWPPVHETVFDESIEETLANIPLLLAEAKPSPRRGDFSAIKLSHEFPAAERRRGVQPALSAADLRRYQLLADLSSLLNQVDILCRVVRQVGDGHFSVTIFASPVSAFLAGTEHQQTLRLAAEGEEQSYADGPGRPLEGRLPEIAAALLALAEKACRTRAQRAYQNELDWRRREAQERNRRARKRRRQRARVRRAELLAQANAWRDAANIRGFVADALAGFPPGRMPTRINNWAKWALAEADAIDPCTEVRRNPPERRQTDHPL